MEFLGTDTYLGPKAKLGTIGERGGSIGIDTGCIYQAEEAVSAGLIFSNDALAMLGTVETDMLKSLIQRGHRLDCHGIGEELGTETLRRGRLQQFGRIATLQGCIGRLISIDEHVAIGQRGTQGREVSETLFVQHQAIKSVADTHTAGLGIVDNSTSLFQIGSPVEIGMTDAGPRLDDRNGGIGTDKIDETAAATRDDKVYITIGMKHLGRSFTAGRKQLHHMGIDTEAGKHTVDDTHNGTVGTVGIATSLEHTGIATLETEREDIKTDIRTGFVDDTYHTEGNTHTGEFETIGQHMMLQDPTKRTRQLGDLAHIGRNVLQTGGSEFQTVVLRIGLVHTGQVFGILCQDIICLSHSLIGHGQQDFIDAVSFQHHQLTTGSPHLFKNLFHLQFTFYYFI